MHLKFGGSSVEGILVMLPRVSAAGIAAPVAKRLVRPELHEVYLKLAAGVEDLSAELSRCVAELQGHQRADSS